MEIIIFSGCNDPLCCCLKCQHSGWPGSPARRILQVVSRPLLAKSTHSSQLLCYSSKKKKKTNQKPTCLRLSRCFPCVVGGLGRFLQFPRYLKKKKTNSSRWKRCRKMLTTLMFLLIYFHSTRTAHKSSKKLYEQCVKLEKLWSHVFTTTVPLTQRDTWYRKLREAIDREQNQAIWVSEAKVIIVIVIISHRAAAASISEFSFFFDRFYGISFRENLQRHPSVQVTPRRLFLFHFFSF